MIDSAVIFLASVMVITVTGAFMPGPVFAATIAKGYNDPKAGLKIAAGHALVEVPLITAIFLGFDFVFRDQTVFAIIALVGGMILLYMGVTEIRARRSIIEAKDYGRGSFATGIITTASNPYWMFWWATVGAALITNAIGFGLVMLPLFIVAHLAVDFGWEHFVATTVNRSKGLWNRKWHQYLIVASAAIMIVFALWFIFSSFTTLIRL